MNSISERPAPASNATDAPHLLVLEGIARRRVISARYNRETIELAPHLLFSRHEELFVAALNLNKQWRSDEEPRLGQFKLAGLSELTLTEQEFAPLPGFEPAAPSPTDEIVFAVA